jgi:hypothetical protein
VAKPPQEDPNTTMAKTPAKNVLSDAKNAMILHENALNAQHLIL